MSIKKRVSPWLLKSEEISKPKMVSDGAATGSITDFLSRMPIK
jgi:hypothetical protein